MHCVFGRRAQQGAIAFPCKRMEWIIRGCDLERLVLRGDIKDAHLFAIVAESREKL